MWKSIKTYNFNKLFIIMKKTVLLRSLKLIMYFKKQFLKHNF